ncbi:MAG: hypothetical protein H6702_16205 [Myxococcales bacterium]|nr:hypothetical protein [Myxococcales bacterium]
MPVDAIDTRSARPLGAGGHMTGLGAVRDPDLARRFKTYKRAIASRYRALTPDEIAQYAPPGPLLASPKVDGEMWFLVLEGGDAWLANPGGRVIYGAVPVLEEARKLLGPRVTTEEDRTIIAGELFAIRKGARPRHDDLAKALGGEAAAETARVGFFGFDLVWGGDRERVGPFESYDAKLEVLTGLFQGGKRCQAVPTDRIEGPAAIEGMYAQLVESGKAEGLVLRTQDARTYKLKPSFTLDAVVIGYTERTEEPGRVRSMALALIREDGQFHIVGSCGNMPGLTREAMFQRLEPLGCESSFRYASLSGALYRFVRPEVVIEVKVTDVVADEPSGEPLLRMVCAYDPAAQHWKAVRRMPGVSLLHPVFVRERSDKHADAIDARMGQVSERVLVEDLTAKVEAVDLPPSQVLRREVYTKTTKGQMAVRKLLVWQTNKAEVDPRYPAFVVHFTDYSAGRKDPLKRTVRLAPTAEAAEALAEDLLQANIKKGWTLA